MKNTKNSRTPKEKRKINLGDIVDFLFFSFDGHFLPLSLYIRGRFLRFWEKNFFEVSLLTKVNKFFEFFYKKLNNLHMWV